MKTRFNNDIRKYFSHLNKMLFCLPAVYNLLGFFFFFLVYFFLWGFLLPLARSVLTLIIWLFFSPSGRVASTKLIVFMYVNRF